MAAMPLARARWHLTGHNPHRTGIVMICIQRIRHSLGVLAGLANARGAVEQVAGGRRAAMRRAGDLAVAGRRPFGVVVVLAAPLLFAGTANAIAAASPGGNATVVSAWNAVAPETAWAAPLAGFPDRTAKTDGLAFGERVAQELTRLRAHGRSAPVLVTTPTAPGMRLTASPALAPRLDMATPPAVNSATRFAPAAPPALGSGRYPRAFIEWKLSARSPHRFAPPRPPAHASGLYPRAYIEWKLSARPPQQCRRPARGTRTSRLISTAIPAATRHYRSRQTLRADVADPRARLGIHFRFVDVTAAKPPITLAG
jgi:hypothetical protein